MMGNLTPVSCNESQAGGGHLGSEDEVALLNLLLLCVDMKIDLFRKFVVFR
jgi:hypothetical protein